MTPHLWKKKPHINEIFTQFFLSERSFEDKNIINKIIIYDQIILVF